MTLQVEDDWEGWDGDTIVKEVMVPRTEMVYIEHTKTLRQGVSLALRSGFSRIPVVGEDVDDVVGGGLEVFRQGNDQLSERQLPKMNNTAWPNRKSSTPTKAMIATTGKARSLGERSIGHPDPGAISMVIILTAMRDFVAR